MVIALSLAGSDHLLLRERLAGPLARPRAAGPPGIELLPIVTCHRIELFGAAEVNGSRDLVRVRRSMAQWAATGRELGGALAHASLLRTGVAAQRHLLRLAAGLESPVLGDLQIGGQVRRAYGAARTNATIGTVLDRLAQTALRTARRVRREAAFQWADRSVAAQAVAAAEAQLGAPLGGRCLVVGAGDVATGLAERLARRNGVELIVLNRTAGRAEDLARRTGGRAAAWEYLPEETQAARVVFLATGAAGPILDASMLARDDRYRETLVLDLGMPRNARPEIASLPGVALLDLECVERQARAAAVLPPGAVNTAESIVESELAGFERWLADAAHRRALVPFRARVEAVCRREIGFCLDAEAAELVTRRIVARLSRDRLAAERRRAPAAVANG